MLRKIEVKQLQPGMYIQSLCCSWMDHPFVRKSFELKDLKDIERIMENGISEVVIDTEKGLDLPSAAPKKEAVATPVIQSSEPVITPIAEEIERAANIVAKSKEAVTSMFQEARMGKAVEAEDVKPLVDEIASSVARNPGALISIARLKTADDYTYMHSVAVCGLMVALAKQIGLDEKQSREAGFAGLLHDVGKMAIPIEVLNKPGKLTDEEFDLVKKHPEAGHEMLLGGKGVSDIALDVCLHHHEKVDGSGYPHRLAGDNISLFAKMGAVCDVYDAVTSDRPYKQGWDPAEAVTKMASWAKGHFDEKIFQAFIKSVGIYPVGSLVRLQTGRLAVVVEQSGRSLLTPKVKVFFSTKSQVRLTPEIVDLSRSGNNDRIVAQEDPVKWGFGDLVDLWRGGAVK